MIKIPLFCASDENYAPFMAIMMHSVLMNTKSFIDFYVLDGGISRKTKKLISSDLHQYKNKKIKYIDMKQFSLSRFPNIKHYSLNTFSRYFIPSLFPKLEKVLYLDVDIIVKHDILELYQQEMDNFPIAAVLEDFYKGNYTYLKENIYPSFNGKDQYFNAGVLLLNIPQLINMKMTDKAIQLTLDLFHKLSCPDQDVFNILFENNFKKLDYRFNYMPDHINLLKEKHPKIKKIDPVIIHYTGPKPWKTKSLASDDFNNVLKLSLFKQKIQWTYPQTINLKTPVLLITFNRLDYVKETLKAISKVKPSKLYLASDGPRENKFGEKEQVQAVRDYILSHIDWPCKIHKRFLEKNSGGCMYGVSGAVTWFFEHEAEGIILEDDCVANPSFFCFCEELLEKYRNDKRIWHIAGDAPIQKNISDSYYFGKIQHCWGWASWANRWKHFSLDVSNYGTKELKKFSKHKTVQKYWKNILDRLKKNQIDTWDYQWTFNIVSKNGLCINPTFNLVSNIGEVGVHYSGKNNDLRKKTFTINELKHPKKVHINQKLVDQIYTEKFKIKLKTPTQKTTKYYLFGIPFIQITENK